MNALRTLATRSTGSSVARSLVRGSYTAFTATTPTGLAISPGHALFSTAASRRAPASASASAAASAPGTMKALVYAAAGRVALRTDYPRPTLQQPTDAIVRVTKTTICGTDLHILKGDVATCTPGRVLGHEGVGVVEEAGASVTTFKPGDRVLISCISSCAACTYCRRGMYSHCTTGGWILGNAIDGTQAEYVRIPHADASLYALPAASSPSSAANDDQIAAALVMLSDIFPTGFECGVLNGRVQPGSTVAIVGAGPVGLAALLTAQLYAPAQLIVVDRDANRLRVARALGAHATVANDAASGGDEAAAAAVLRLTDGVGCDAVLEAVGVPASFALCQQLLAPGGTLANVGVHGTSAALHLETLWDRNVTITTRLVDTATLPMLLKLVRSGRLDPSQLITHKFKFDEMEKAYETFGTAAKTNALKVLVEME